MADGRSFGLLPYMQAGDLNVQLMSELGASDNASYRAILTAKGLDISRQAFQKIAGDTVDQGCCVTTATSKVTGPVPSNYSS
jgi:hypothetical protein